MSTRYAALLAAIVAEVGVGAQQSKDATPPAVGVQSIPPDAGAPAEGPPPGEIVRERALAFGKFKSIVKGPARSVGGYSNGCVLGAVALPKSGPGFELLHLGRNRRYGHPDLIAFIRRLSLSAKKKGLSPLLIGDLGQPRGGVTLTGHRSHQTGLDVDVGFSRPAWMQKRAMTTEERESMSPPPVVDLRTHTLLPLWSAKIAGLIELAARDPGVDRLFVNPAIKERLCKDVRRDRGWLHVVRPWWAHHDHLHVRLHCPAASPECEKQNPIPPGDGCGELTWWLGETRRPPDAPPPPTAAPRPPPPLPETCRALFGGHPPP